ncbi:MAG: hypothetical protein SF172_00330 [Burkholderiales bacterium]|nr:hypothetical protein [Burkholderiales bacterium]
MVLHRCLGFALLAVLPVAHASDERLGKLPAGAQSTNLVQDVGAEICRDHVFDPAKAKVALPKGFRLISLDEYAKGDPDATKLLARNPTHANHAVGSLCFMSVGSFVIDDKRVAAPSPMPMAFWWARAEGPRDARMQGKVEWVQLASWYPNSASDRARIMATDPMAQFVEIHVAATAANTWRMRLVLSNETIEAEAKGRGDRKPRKSSGPGFMSVPFSGASAGSFWVITYFGHHHQSATGQWRASGNGVFADAFSIAGESEAFGTLFQDGWTALSGVYK